MWKMFGALNWLVEASPTALQTLDTLIDRATNNVSPSSDPLDCTDPPSHPNLCTLHKDQPTPLNDYAGGTGSVRNACHLHECELDTAEPPDDPNTASHVHFKVAIPEIGPFTSFDVFSAVNGSTILKICKVEPIPVLGDALGGDFRLLAGVPARSARPINLLGLSLLCVESVTAEGWCDCTGRDVLHVNVDVCGDHTTSNGDACGGTTEAEECFCTPTPPPCGGSTDPPCSSTEVACTSDKDCGADQYCGAGNFGQSCHPGTEKSTLLTTSPGIPAPPGAGHCVNVGTSSLTPIPLGASGGICDDGPDDGELCEPDGIPCTPPGECLAFIGPDEEACTMDDLIPRGPQGTIPSTTGTASTSLSGAISQDGGCTGPRTGTCVAAVCVGGWNAGKPCTVGPPDSCRRPCLDDANCAGSCSVTNTIACDAGPDCPTTETCVSSTCTNPAPVLIDLAVFAKGAPIDCAGYESSDLEGFVLVKAFPIPDTSAFGDGVTTNRFVCD
jgi:hypothetical protein